MALIAGIDAAARFLRCERDVVGLTPEALAQSASHQVQTLIQTVRAAPINVEDATAAMESINGITDVFTEPQRRAVVTAISDAVRGADIGAGVNAGHQHHFFIYEYVPDKVWSVLLDKDLPWDAKRDELIAFVLGIGVVDPCELSFRVMVATLIVAAGVHFVPQQAFQKLLEFKRSFYLRRKTRGSLRSMDSFPKDVTQFTSVYADRYDPGHPPVKSPINVESVDLWCQKDHVPARKSNASLRSFATSPRTPTEASSPRTPSADNTVIGVLTTLLDRVLPHQQPLSDQQPAATRNRSGSSDFSLRYAPEIPALEDAKPGTQTEVAPAPRSQPQSSIERPSSNAEPSPVESLAAMRAQMAAAFAAKASKGKKGKKGKKGNGNSDASAGRADEIPPTTDERESSAAMKRRPAAADDPAPAAIRRRLSGKQPVDNATWAAVVYRARRITRADKRRGGGRVSRITRAAKRGPDGKGCSKCRYRSHGCARCW